MPIDVFLDVLPDRETSVESARATDGSAVFPAFACFALAVVPPGKTELTNTQVVEFTRLVLHREVANRTSREEVKRASRIVAEVTLLDVHRGELLRPLLEAANGRIKWL